MIIITGIHVQKEGRKNMKLKDLKPGEYFTLEPIASPIEDEVYIRGLYAPTPKRYECIECADFGTTLYLKGETEVYTDFIF